MKKKFLEKEEYQKILDLAKEVNIRDYILFLLAGNFGLRVGEVVRLRKQDFDFEKKLISIPSLKVKGDPMSKGKFPKKYIELSLGKKISANRLLIKWVKESDNLLFSGKLSNDYLTESAVQKVFRWYVKKLGIEVSFHSLRHYRGDTIYKATKDLKVVQASLRHVSLASTSIYMHPGIKEIENSMDQGGFLE